MVTFANLRIALVSSSTGDSESYHSGMQAQVTTLPHGPISAAAGAGMLNQKAVLSSDGNSPFA